MQKNVSGQVIGCQMTTIADGSAFTGSVTVYVTKDGGTQAVGSVGSGACTHEGNGFHTYAPAQAETNADHIAFTFVGTGAFSPTVQVYTRFDANVTHNAGTAITSTSGVQEVKVQSVANNAITAAAIATDAIDADSLKADAVSAIQSGLATAANLLKYFQLLFRKDAAIAADNATQLTAINADGGSGAGSYDNQNDSIEAIRDRGDLSWVTGGGGGSGDWTADELTALRTILGVPASGTTPDTPTAGGIADLLGRLTATRAGYLDKLNISGNVASSAEASSFINNTRCVRSVPQIVERPDSGTTTYRIELFLYDSEGNMEAPDSAPTIALVNQGGTDLSSRLDSTTMSLVSTGKYRSIYTASDTDDLEQLKWEFSVVEGGNTRVYGNDTVIVDTTAVDFTSADRTKLDTLAADYTTARAAKLDNLDATVSSRLADADYTAPLDANGIRGAVGLASANLDTQIGLLATWAKVRKWLQLLFRKDTAIATDNATELAEINADGGSGAGSYDNTTDSLEARAEAGYVCQFGINPKSTEGNVLQLRAWLETDGQFVDLHVVDDDATISIAISEHESGVVQMTAGDGEVPNDNGVFEFEYDMAAEDAGYPNLVDDRGYTAFVSITVNGTTYTTLHEFASVGGE